MAEQPQIVEQLRKLIKTFSDRAIACEIPATKYFIVVNDGTDAVTGTFASITGLGAGYAVVYDADSGGDRREE